jgi:ribosomal-protein-alanine N-acetyltransferase
MAIAPQRSVAITIEPMRKRHVRAVLAIEDQVYPRPWTAALFQSELALTETRMYVVAKSGRDVVGYAGLMMSLTDGHITTLAVDPARHRERIATQLMLVVARSAVERGATALTLEVRLSNRAAQGLYRRFGFAPVGVRTGYYQDPPGTSGDASREDALVMWAHDVATPAYTDLLDQLAGS